ncbi:tail protein [Caballeronia cordobensis]|uniref:Tail protein n=1 Tax=Caballeronia cordobensis TaxID=1353886 RepID=A0A158FMG2_CABCO|nr:phage GP46 family protein [Caballeronia cordobensis]SAL20811.1 tail protein [Caballeronia cordobensis]
MPSYAQDVPLYIDGVESSLLAETNPLVRAVIMSLFTWRRAEPDDPIDDTKWGWWGDNVSDVENDQIGSRLWLLAREKLTQSTLNRAEQYAKEALAHLIDDGVATRVTVAAERIRNDGLGLTVTIYRVDAAATTLRFSNVWSLINNV